jgi:hypothetical protein
LPLDVFEEHKLDGKALTQLTTVDLQDLFALEPVGVRHRLVYCIQRAADVAAPELLTTDFEGAMKELQAWLTEKGVSHDHRQLLAEAKFDIVTCGELDARALGSAKVPLAARKQLLMLLRQARAVPEMAASHGDVTQFNVELQQMVLELVLEENAGLAARLKQHSSRDGQEVPSDYLCPITREVMEDPVIAEDGVTYEREAIATWVAAKETSPVTRQRMPNRFIPNRALKAVIARWQEKEQ